MKTNRLLDLLSFCLAVLAILIPFWALMPAAILLLIAGRRFILAVLLGFCADLLYGAPVGMLEYIFFPFTAFAGAAAYLLYALGKNWVLKDDLGRL